MRAHLSTPASWLAVSLAVAFSLAPRPAAAIGRSAIVARAQEWVDAKLLYCVSTQGAYDATCKYTCNRQDNPAWNGYFSDCSGLITWAWGLTEAQRLYTGSIAPYGGNQSFKIDAHDLQPGDALNDRSDPDGDGKLHHHVMLFAGWKIPGKVATIIQESGCGKVANRTEQNVQYVGDKLQVGQYAYHAVRFNGVAADESCQAHCEGTKIVGADCGTGDCAAYGATCLDDASGPRCVYEACPASGTYDVCLDQNRIAKCVDGIPTNIGDCSVYAAFCSTIAGAHCASHFCAEPNVQPAPHTTCFIDGSILTCDDKGTFTSAPCPAGTKCSVYGSPHCDANNGCPATGDQHLCLEGRAVRCYEGTLAEVVDCPAQGRGCAVVDGLPVCTEENSGDGPPPEPPVGAAGGGGAAGAAGSPSGGGGSPVGAAGASSSAGAGGGGASSSVAGTGGGAGAGAGAAGKAGDGGGLTIAGGSGSAGSAGAGGRLRGSSLPATEPAESCAVGPVSRASQAPFSAGALFGVIAAVVARRRLRARRGGASKAAE